MRIADAHYLPQSVPLYIGNPFIEALPPIRSRDDLCRLLANPIAFDEAQTRAPPEVRLHLVLQLIHLFQPLTPHFELAEKFDLLLRSGYVTRNPIQPAFLGGIVQLPSGPLSPTIGKMSSTARARCSSLIGISGVGKTSAVDACLALYDQVVTHSQYTGHALTVQQLTFLKLECPHDGSIRALCYQFFYDVDRLLGTSYMAAYAKRTATTETMMINMARVAALHGLGALVIDELQNLSQAKSGGADLMLNFFVFLENRLGVPVFLVGTYKAIAMISTAFRQCRRASGLGELTWDRMTFDDEHSEFAFFCETLWEYQYLPTPVPLTGEFLEALYDESQGITDVIVKLFMLGQMRAVVRGDSSLTPELIRSVAADSLRLIRPLLRALRDNDGEALLRHDDLLSTFDWDAAFTDMSRTQTDNAIKLVRSEPPPARKRVRRTRRTRTQRAVSELDEADRPADVLNTVRDAGTERNFSGHDSLTKAGFVRSLSEDRGEHK